MRLSTILCSILVFLLSAPVGLAQKSDNGSPAGPAAMETPFSNVRRENLLNGLQIVTLERPADATIKCLIVIRTGSMFDSIGKSGLVAMTQRTLLAVNPQLREEMESLQTRIEWGVDWDKTWFRLEMPPANFEAALEILGRLLVVETIRPDAFKRAQQEQVETIRRGFTPERRADEAFHQALFGDYPYGRNVLGTELTVSNLRQGDVYDIFERFYLANNAAIILTGKVAPERSLRTFKYLFGGWSKGSSVPATFRQPVPPTQLKVVRVEDAAAEQTELRGGIIGVRYASPEFPLTQLLVEVLIQRWARESGGATSPVQFSAENRILAGPLQFKARVAPTETEALSQKLTGIFAGLATSPVTDVELAQARTTLLQRLDARSIEDWLFEIEAFSLPRNYPLALRSRLNTITSAELQTTAKRLIESSALTLVVLGRSPNGTR